jgi:hypothetical protein
MMRRAPPRTSHFCTMRLDEIATEAAAHRAAVAALLQRHLPYVMHEALAHHELDVLVPALLTLHASANHASHPAVASSLYASAYTMAQQLMDSLPRRDYPLECAQVCLVLNDLEAVLDRNVEGIYHARLARDWAIGGGTKASQLLGKDADELWGNALVAEAVSFHNLGLDGKARVILTRAVFTERSNPWAGEAALHRLKYTALAQKTSLRHVDTLPDLPVGHIFCFRAA